MATEYLFIDGGYLDGVLRTYERSCLEPNEEIRLSYKEFARSFQRKFYYDCLPHQNDGEAEEDYNRRAAPKRALFEKLRLLDGFHVFDGWTKRHRKIGVMQKGVDVMLAVDMLHHTVRRNMQKATLLAGDLDFKPVVDELVQEGMHITIWGETESTHPELVQSADCYRRLTFYEVMQFCLGNAKEKYYSYFTVESSGAVSEWIKGNRKLEKRGKSSKGLEVSLLKHGDSDVFLTAHVAGYHEDGTSISIIHRNQRVIDRTLVDYGVQGVIWEPV